VLASARGPASAETVDRVAASVGRTAITASEVEQEYRLELFLEGKSPASAEPGQAVLEQVRSRIIDRVLLQEEVQASGIHVGPDDRAVAQRLQEVRDKFPAPQAFEEGLRGLGITEDELRRHLAEQVEVLRLIDIRLRPEVTVEEPEIEAYYHGTLIPELARQGQQPPPALSGVEDQIREILVQKKINLLLEAWLERLRAGHDVRLYGSPEAEDTK
jgi:SurA N-terminal domain